MANFYIATMVSTMQTHGTAFLSRCFQQRHAQRVTSLNATASLLLSQLNPVIFALLVADCGEAGVCGNVEEMSLNRLLNGAVAVANTG